MTAPPPLRIPVPADTDNDHADRDIEEAVASLRRSGAAVLREVMTPSQTHELRRAILRHATRKPHAAVADADLIRAHEVVPLALELVTSSCLALLARLVCGSHCEIRTINGTVRAKGSPELPLHTDLRTWYPSPYDEAEPALSLNLVCDDFARSLGATSFVPGSHLLRREPTSKEVRAAAPEPLEARLGDAVLWLAGTWHGRFERIAEGERVVLTVVYSSAAVPLKKRNRILVDGRWKHRSSTG